MTARNDEIEAAWTAREVALVLTAMKVARLVPGCVTVGDVLDAVDLRHPRPTHQRRHVVPLEERAQTEIEGTGPRPPSAPQTPTEARDETLVELDRTRAELVDRALVIADMIDRDCGRVTSVEVMARLRALPELAVMLDACDGRWLGSVFGRSRGWRRIGMENTGHKARPVSIWTRRTT